MLNRCKGKDAQIQKLQIENTRLKETTGLQRNILNNMKTKFEEALQTMQTTLNDAIELPAGSLNYNRM